MDWPEIYRRFQRDRNDSQAWEALEQRVQPWARSALWERGRAVVDDAIADTCSTIVISLEKARGPDTFRGFAIGHFYNVRNKILATPVTQDVANLGKEIAKGRDPGPTPEELELLRVCLAELPLRERQAVWLRFKEDAAAAQIAGRLNVTEGNARRIVFNGMARLRQCAKRHWPEGRG